MIVRPGRRSGRSPASASAGRPFWQAPAEGGIPRYVALYQTADPPSVGPVRSSRVYFIGWAAEWNALYVTSAARRRRWRCSPRRQGAAGRVERRRVPVGRDVHLAHHTAVRAPQNTYSDGAHLQALSTAVGAPPVPDQAPVWRFGRDAPLAERPDGRLDRRAVPRQPYRVRLRPQVEHLPADRDRRGVPRSTAGTGARVGAEECRDHDDGVSRRSTTAAARRRLEAAQVGSGRAWIATNGRTIAGTWRKDSFTAPTLFFGPDGSPVILTAGQTFVQVVPTGTAITIADGVVQPHPGLVGRHDPGGGSAS